MKEFAEKQIKKIDKVIDHLELLDEKGRDLLMLVKSYHTDAKYFLNKGDYVRAFEASTIVWAYIDAGLHLGVFKLPKQFKDLFTV